jgi:hypothetical protein
VRPKGRWEDHIEMNINGVEYAGIYLSARNRVQRQALINKVLYLRAS